MTTVTTQPYARKAAPGLTHNFLGHLFTYLADGADTGGSLAVFEVVVRKGDEPPPHIHTREDEAYYVLEGRFVFTVGEQTIEADAGTFVWLPRGVVHSFLIDADGARALILAYPAGLEEVFKAFSTPAADLQLPAMPEDPPLDEVIGMDRRYGVIYPGIPEA